MFSRITQIALRRTPLGAPCVSPSFGAMGKSSEYADQRGLPDNVYVPEGGPRVSTPEMDPIRHSLTDADPVVRHSLLDPKYHAHSSTKAFRGWDPRSYGNSLGSSLRDPAYDVSAFSGAPVLPHRRTVRRRG